MIGVTKNQQQIDIPEFVRCLHHSLNNAYSTIKQNRHAAHQHNKARYDGSATQTHFAVGDQVWLYVPTVKTDRTKNLASLWWGPYTVIDRISPDTASWNTFKGIHCTTD